jgi:hypothetical protein
MREDEDLVQFVQELERDIEQIKATQFLGRDSMLSYQTSSASQYDITIHLDPGESQSYRLTLDHAKAKGGAILNLNAFYRLDDANVMADPVFRHPPTNPHIAVTWYKETAADTSTSWIVKVENITFVLGHDAYVKFYIDGTDTGSWTITAI